MITRIEIDGFKSFQKFDVSLRPFQVLIGPNGVGKSNLFDAIVLLSYFARENTLYDAFRQSRGEINELFALLPNGERTRFMRFAVEMLIDKSVTDEFGVMVDVSSTRLRYEVNIERRNERGFERLYIVQEDLTAISGREDSWTKENIDPLQEKKWIVRSKGRRSPYISTEDGSIFVHQDKRAGGKLETPIGKIERTLLSTVASTEYPTVYAVRQEMMNWHFLQFNPELLREPSHIYAKTELLPDGSNLAAVLHRMSREDEDILTDVSLNMANLVPGILKINIDVLREREQFLIHAKTRDGSILSSRVLSDGTLRILALVTLLNDPRRRGILCLEEPENGVTPERLSAVVELLKDMATDFHSDDDFDTGSLHQVLINTHSTNLLSYVEPESLLYVFMVEREPRVTRVGRLIKSVFGDYEDKSLTYFTLDKVRSYLTMSAVNTEQLERIEAIKESF